MKATRKTETRTTTLLLTALLATAIYTTPAGAQTLAFPEAEGFGRYATGARTNLAASSVYHVTNLNDSGPGSFRDAVSQPNRFVVFDVGGIATIESVVTVASNITIAGQTSPGGFSLYHDRISFTNSHNLISRHFAVRKGDAGVRDDTASIARGSNMIFDHMSITWGVDGTFDINHDSGHVIDNITIQNTIIGQGLDRLGHSTGGLMQPGEGGSVSVIRSLWADNVTRNPKARRENEFINNVVYGYENAGYIMGDTTSADSWANVQGNYFIEGPVNGSSPFASGTANFHIYATDNWVDTNRDGVQNGVFNSSYPGADVVGTRHDFPTFPSMTASQAVTHVANNAGLSIFRDAVDTRLTEEVLSFGTLGGVIQYETDLFPGWGSDPSYLLPRSRFADVDNDGMADFWEVSRGLSPANATDWKGLNGAGYTRLEEYVNELGAEGAEVASSGGAWTSAASWGGAVPTLADDAVTSGAVTHAGGHAFARRLHAAGAVTMTGGTLNVFDTATLEAPSTINGGVASLGRVLIGAPGQPGSLSVGSGALLRTGTVAANGAGGTLVLDGGWYEAGGTPDISVPTTLGTGGGVFDTGDFSGSVSGAVSGSGGLTKRGAGALTLSGAKSYTGPTSVEEGELIVQGGGLSQSSDFELGSGATLNMASVSGGLVLGSGQSLAGSGTVIGDVTANSGAVIQAEGTLGDMSSTGAIAIQAEDLALGSDWAIFDNAAHGTGAGGSYNGADLNGGGIVLVAGESLAAPTANGAASTTVNIPQLDQWYLFARVAEPAVSPIPGDSATQPGGNNSFWASGTSSSLDASLANYEEVQTLANPGNEATWNRVSPSLASLEGVMTPINAGIDYNLTAGEKTFTIYGREIGTVIDAFVLSDSNLTAAQLDEVLNGPPATVLTVDGDFFLTSGATLAVDVDGGDARNMLVVQDTAVLVGDLSLTLADGFTPGAGDTFEVLTAGSLAGQFANAAQGQRLMLADSPGSFLVNYDYGAGTVTLSDFLALVPGDANGDGAVDILDLDILSGNFGTMGGATVAQGDFNADGNVDILDLDILSGNFGFSPSSSLAIPEPGAALLALAMFGLAAAGTNRSR